MTERVSSKKINQLLTLVIISFKSEAKVEKIVNKFYKYMGIIVVDNTNSKLYKKKLNFKFKKIKIISKKNIGYGSAINCASKYVKTKYFFAINPDLNFNLKCISNILIAAEILNGKFGVLGPSINNTKKNQYKTEIVKSVNGSAMLFNKKIFQRIGKFDSKFFLYYEENDYCLRSNKAGYKSYIINNAKLSHEIGKSAVSKCEKTNLKLINLKHWHGQWSKFYYLKKHYGFFKAMSKVFPLIILNLVQLIISIFFNHKKTQKHFYKLYGLCWSILNKKAFLRPFI